MKGLDTNVLVRYFTQDDPLQSVAAERCIETACTEEQPCLIHVVVLCELVWVLETAFGYSRDQIAEVLDLMLHTRQYVGWGSFVTPTYGLLGMNHYAAL